MHWQSYRVRQLSELGSRSLPREQLLSDKIQWTFLVSLFLVRIPVHTCT